MSAKIIHKCFYTNGGVKKIETTILLLEKDSRQYWTVINYDLGRDGLEINLAKYGSERL
jgi:hypothetical protein